MPMPMNPPDPIPPNQIPLDKTVFIVDDDDAVRDSLAILLESAGLQVETFASPIAFLASDAPARPGCLLTDVRMPHMSGLELQERLVREGRRLPVVVMTGHADVPLAVRAMKVGAVDFIEKPFEDQLLIDSILAALNGRHQDPEPAAAPAAAEAIPGCPPEIAARLALLTPRERDVLHCLVDGKSNKMIAYDLSISPRTVEIHRARVMEKMQAGSLPLLVRMTLEAGIHPRKP
jgi:two-component system response regulator FixJ